MAGRYIITGVQIGMLKAIDSKKERDKILETVIDEQFIGESVHDIGDDVKWHERAARKLR